MHWTLPEPNVNRYSDELISSAKAFSDTAIVMISRSGGEGVDLPTDMSGVIAADGKWMSDVSNYYNYYNYYDDTLNEGGDWNAGDHYLYDNTDEHGYGPINSRISEDLSVPHFVNYVEGIYVGYKFWETADAEGIVDYDASVAYPFGYGLSYTTFTQEMSHISESNGVLSFDVTVTNTGSVAGKDVVEIYFNPPYTNGGIEKASANLIAFDKTDIIEPGASQTVPISFRVEDMASYDMSGNGRYVLEQGDYIISINSDSHTVLDSQTYTVSDHVDYSAGRSTDLTAPSNQFGFANGGVTYLSRADHFANYDEATAAPASLSMSDENKAMFVSNHNYNPADHNDPNDTMPATGVSSGLKLEDMRGVDYADAQWNTFLDQLTTTDMDTLIALGGYQTAEVPSIGKVQTYDCDGPASINNNFTGQGSIGFAGTVMMASTWNTDTVYKFGASIGHMANELGVSGWYAPAMNIHRTALGGRNFEYYSEDGVLSGRLAAYAVQGADTYGVYSYIKHFALNEQETNRLDMAATWCNEQAIREIYLRPFEIAVKEGGANAVMSSFNYIGPKWTGACPRTAHQCSAGRMGLHWHGAYRLLLPHGLHGLRPGHPQRQRFLPGELRPGDQPCDRYHQRDQRQGHASGQQKYPLHRGQFPSVCPREPESRYA